MSAPQKIRKVGRIVALSLLGLVTILFVVITILLRTEPPLAILFGVLSLSGLGLLSFGVLSLIGGVRKKVWSIICTAVGGQLVLFFLLLVAYGTLISLVSAPVKHYDYRDHLAQISSVELVEITKTGTFEDEFTYRVIAEIPPELWEELVDELAQLEYKRPFDNPHSWREGQIKFLIRFSPSVDGVCFVLIGDSSPCYGKRDGSRVRINSTSESCNKQEWKALAAKYGLEEFP